MFFFFLFLILLLFFSFFFFFFNDTATTEIYTLSLHDALPISARALHRDDEFCGDCDRHPCRDRKSTRLNSSHRCISYAVFCLKKKKKNHLFHRPQKKQKKKNKTKKKKKKNIQ